MPLRLRRLVARASGFRLIPFDPVLRDRHGEPARREAWLRDQYQHPEEHRHTLAEVQGWFTENRVEYLRAYPSAVLGDEPSELFVRAADNWRPEGWLLIHTEIKMQPGATVTATRENQQRVTVTDQQGVYRFANIADGVWTLRIEMLGFATINQDVTVDADTPAPTWDLELLPFEEITRGLPPPGAEAKEPPRAPIAGRQAGAAPLAAPPAAPSGFRRAQVKTSAAAGAITNDPTAADADRNQAAADGFLINGSVNNGAASPFAQLAAFGNNRRGGRSLYNGGLGVLLGNSAWDARPFSFTSQQTPKPSYSDVQILGSFAGPLKIPGVIKNGPTLLLGYQRTVNHNASTQSAVMPTLPERAGNFSHTVDRFGRPLRLVVDRVFEKTKGVQVLDLGLGPKRRRSLQPHRHVRVAPEASFFHVAVVDAERDEQLAQITEERRGVLTGSEIGLGDDLDERSAGAIEIDVAAPSGIGKALVEQLSRVLFHVDARDTDVVVARPVIAAWGNPPPAAAVPGDSRGVPSELSSPGLPPAMAPGRLRVEAPQSSPGTVVGNAPGFAQTRSVDEHEAFTCAIGLHFERHIDSVPCRAGNRTDDDALGLCERIDD